MSRVLLSVALSFAWLPAACSGGGAGDRVDAILIGDDAPLLADGLRLDQPQQVVRAATTEGLVAFDETGQIVPALAERWIVTDDGLSYIFRLRDIDGPDGEPVEASEIRRALEGARGRLAGTSLGLDLAVIDEVRAMTGRVIEIRLKSPLPGFLQLLAQAEMGVLPAGTALGPMRAVDTPPGVTLAALSPEQRGLPTMEDWQDAYRPVTVRRLPAAAAVARFRDGDADLVTGGTLASFPLADPGPLSRGTIRLDAAIGLFGLAIHTQEGFFADPANRRALSLAIDRDALIEPFNIGGWVPATRIVPAALSPEGEAAPERFAGLALEARRAQAAARVAAWEAANATDLSVRIGLPEGPGADQLFAEIAEDLAAVGITATQTTPGDGAELELRDRLARYGGPSWFLNQFNCSLRAGLCSPRADALVAAAMAEPNAIAQRQLLESAEEALLEAEVFVPLGMPVRWSLVRGDLSGFAENVFAVHPLFPLALRPI